MKSTAHPMFKHGHTAGGRSKEWTAWKNMINRCTRTCTARYKRYGGRGITVCSRWIESFENFFADVGFAPSSEYQLDRKNNNGNYEPENVRWASRSEQIKNSTKARYIEAFGKRQTIGDWAAETGIKRRTIQMRIDAYGWPADVALSAKVRHRI